MDYSFSSWTNQVDGTKVVDLWDRPPLSMFLSRGGHVHQEIWVKGYLYSVGWLFQITLLGYRNQQKCKKGYLYKILNKMVKKKGCFSQSVTQKVVWIFNLGTTQLLLMWHLLEGFFAYHLAVEHPHTNMILSWFSIPLVLKCASKILKINCNTNKNVMPKNSMGSHHLPEKK